MITRLLDWLHNEMFRYRLTHGRCTECGQRRVRLGGTTMCRTCFERAYPFLASLRRDRERGVMRP